VPEDRFEGLGVLGSAVGAQIRLVHARIMPSGSATWLALPETGSSRRGVRFFGRSKQVTASGGTRGKSQ
jgi:hypothetical protein